MEKFIEEVMEELFLIDPSLRQYQKQLEETIMSMIQNKPDTKFDEKFKETLKMELLRKARQLAMEKKPLLSNLNLWLGVSFAAVATAVVLIAVLPTVNNQQKSDNKNLPALGGGVKISKIGDNAFGKLGGVVSLGTGGQSQGITDSATNPLLPPPEGMTTYKFIYTGEDFSLPQEVEVLSRVKDCKSGGQEALLGAIDLGLFNINRIANPKVGSTEIFEDIDDGYSITIQPCEGTVNMVENWRRAKAPVSTTPLRLEDVPADEKLIAAANQFLSKYGFDLSAYGMPVVEKVWSMSTSDSVYVPDSSLVTYPLLINGKEVYRDDFEHNRAALLVSVDNRTLRVANVQDVKVQKYQASNYVGENSKERVMKLVGQGDIRPLAYSGYMGDPDIKNVEIKLGTPKVEYLEYAKDDGRYDELYVPSLVFPIVSVSPAKVSLFQKAVVIPLAKDILDWSESYYAPVTQKK